VLKLTILYRGPLSDCNYACPYCPMPKRRETADERAADQLALERFCDWAEERTDIRLAIFFTPRGEALKRSSYQEALRRLSCLPHVTKTAIQTNLSCSLQWVQHCDPQKLALWCSYHPEQVSHEKFLAQCQQLDLHHIRYSVGVVGIREQYDAAARLRRALNENVYLWVNAYKEEPGYYSHDESLRWQTIDPMFQTNTHPHSSLNQLCRCGHSVISVDGDGEIRPCHFIDRSLGNIYDPNFEQALGPHHCTNRTCGCHIGYVHLRRLGLYDVYGDGVLERIPVVLPH
jgi:MoaA/NifB/PqqE/SkfB family radical SAM enzyme